ncbi:hypothetical protein BEE62_10150 [Marinobacter nauticus]|uniref:Isochorismatase family protein n=1 Tax=Marinobacter nauticus TaxID=2743 RepID=A0A1M2UYJ5_MARNT|nr:hypothetical protein BEE62_10150 [Marinobacter nauticus]
MAFKYNRLNKDDMALLMVDHRSGLLSLVWAFSPDDFKNNVLALADIAKFFDIPTILVTGAMTSKALAASWPSTCPIMPT